MLAVCCGEGGAVGPLSLSDDPVYAVQTRNQRMGRLSVVK